MRNFLADWWRTRDWIDLRWGVFAFVGGSVLMVLVLFAGLQSPRDRSVEYLVAARQMRAKGDLEAASIFYEKSVAELQDDEEALFEWMVVAGETGERVSRDATLRYLVEGANYPPALLYDGGLKLREGRLVEARKMLAESLEAIPREEQVRGSRLLMGLDELRRGLMYAYWRRGDLDDAVGMGEELAAPGVRDETDLAALLLKSGELEVAAAKAVGLVARLPKKSEARDVGIVRALAEAVAGNESEVTAALSRLRANLIKADSEEGRAVLETQVRCFKLLTMSLQAVPDLRMIESGAVAGLPSLASPLISLIDDDALPKALLVAGVADGSVPVAGHLLLGLRAAALGQNAEATMQFSIAGGLAPTSGRLVGWCGLRVAQLGNRRDLALFLGETADKLWPEPEMDLLLGEIFLALGRKEDAERMIERESFPAEAIPGFRAKLEGGERPDQKPGN